MALQITYGTDCQSLEGEANICKVVRSRVNRREVLASLLFLLLSKSFLEKLQGHASVTILLKKFHQAGGEGLALKRRGCADQRRSEKSCALAYTWLARPPCWPRSYTTPTSSDTSSTPRFGRSRALTLSPYAMHALTFPGMQMNRHPWLRR